MQIACYRNYSSGVDEILEVSEWTNNSNKLTEFLKNIEAKDGQQFEALEVALWHANNEIEKSEDNIKPS